MKYQVIYREKETGQIYRMGIIAGNRDECVCKFAIALNHFARVTIEEVDIARISKWVD